MSISRTEIAAMALQGLLACEQRFSYDRQGREEAAQLAVRAADALLYELAKIPSPAGDPVNAKEGHRSESSAGEAGETKGAASPRAAERVECRQEARNRGAPLAPAPADLAHAAGTNP